MRFSNQLALSPNSPPLPLLFVGTVITSSATDYDACSGRLLALSLDFTLQQQPQRLTTAWALNCDSVIMAMDVMVRESERFLVLAKSARLGIMTSGAQISMVNTAQRQELVHQYGPRIIGRMGVPYREKGVNIISVAMDAPGGVISALSGKLGRLEGVTAKTVYAPAGSV